MTELGGQPVQAKQQKKGEIGEALTENTNRLGRQTPLA